MSWVGDLLRAGIDATGSGLKINKAVDFEKDVEFKGTTTLGDLNSVVLPSMGDTDRDELSASDGQVIYNTDFNEPQCYVDGTWKQISTETASS